MNVRIPKRVELMQFAIILQAIIPVFVQKVLLEIPLMDAWIKMNAKILMLVLQVLYALTLLEDGNATALLDLKAIPTVLDVLT